MIPGMVIDTNQTQIDRQALQPIYTAYPGFIEKVRAGVERGVVRLFVSDVDSTLFIGAGHSEDEIARGATELRKLVSVLNQRGDILLPVTGSHFESATSTTSSMVFRIDAGNLPGLYGSGLSADFNVDGYVSDGGARAVFWQSTGSVCYDENYAKNVIATALDYDTIKRNAEQLVEQLLTHELIPLNFDKIVQFDAHLDPDLRRIFPQAGTANGSHRASQKVAFYFYASNLEERDFIESCFVTHFRSLGLKVVCCEEKDANTRARRLFADEATVDGFPLKYCLDIVPYDKSSAVDYFAAYLSHLVAEESVALNKQRPRIEVWACGDSGNDMPLLSHPAVTTAVVVGGASQELLRSCERLRMLGKSVYVEQEPGVIGPGSILKALEAN